MITLSEGKNEALPSCYEAGSYGFLCGEPIPNGFPNKNDPLFQNIDLKLNGKTFKKPIHVREHDIVHPPVKILQLQLLV